MKTFKRIVGLLIFCIPFSINAQLSQKKNPLPMKKVGRWEIAYGVGETYMGSNRDIFNQMIHSGLDD